MKKQALSVPWRKYIPNKAQLGSQGPVALLGLFGFVLALAVILSLVPALKTLDQEIAALSAAEQQVSDARAAQVAELQIIRRQIEMARSGTLSKTELLLTKAQASGTLDQLYQLAASTNVRIVTLQNQPSPETEKPASVDITRFRLHVAGALPDLMRFVALTKQTISAQAFLLSNVNITQGPQSAALLMDLVLFTSSSSTPLGLNDSVAANQPITLTIPISMPEVTPSPTPTSGTNPLLVKPHNWPTAWPWPPKSTPAASAQATPGQNTHYSTYTVLPGDSLSTIASQFRTTVEDLMAANDLVDYTIYVNQKLLVPVQ
jgi:LysM repeat protein